MQLNSSTALSVFQQMFADKKVRAHPVSGPAMEPNFFDGEIVGIEPDDRWQQDGLYLLGDTYSSGIYRCQWLISQGGKIRIWHDNPAFACCEEVLTREEFRDRCLGKIVALCGYPDRPRGHAPRTWR